MFLRIPRLKYSQISKLRIPLVDEEIHNFLFTKFAAKADISEKEVDSAFKRLEELNIFKTVRVLKNIFYNSLLFR